MTLDVLAAVALTGGGLWAVTTLRHDHTVAVTAAASLLCTTAVAWRRLAPLAAAVVALTAVAVYQISGQDPQGVFVTLSVVLACYVAGRSTSSPGRLALLGGYALVAVSVTDVDSGTGPGEVLLTWIPLAIVPLCAGRFVATREALAEELRATRAQLQDERDLVRARTVTRERTRVARELHDVVAHCVSVMVIQAGAARLLAVADPVAARTAVGVVAASGREALADLRRVVGVRRHDDDAYAPATPGLGQIGQLVERTREAGTPVTLHLDASATLPADLDLAAFRIVQEALTNVRKHAPGAHADVTVAVTPDAVEICVVNAGTTRPTELAGAGHGLIGMRERALLQGGDVRAEPTGTGGFAVRARLPRTPDARPQETLSAPSEPVRRRRRLSPLQFDALVSLVWLIPLEVEAVTSPHRAGAAVLTALAVAILAAAGVFRRVFPLAFLVLVGVVALALSGGVAAPQRTSVVGAYTVFVGAYTIAAYLPRTRALFGLGVLLSGLVASTVLHHAGAGVAFGGGLMASLVWACGRTVRGRRELVDDLRTATADLAAERDAKAQTALDEERVRIARDLNTIVARLVTVMVVQAEAVENLLAVDSSEAVEPLATIEQVGRQALDHLRQLLGVLRNRLDPPPRRPPLDIASADLATGVLSTVPT